MSAIWAKYARAERVICIDNVASRLSVAKDIIGCEVINFDEHKDVIARMRELVPGGVDVAIDAVGFRYSKTVTHQAQRTMLIETDSVDVLNECVKCVKKGGCNLHVWDLDNHIKTCAINTFRITAGTLSIIGDYVGNANGFPIGAVPSWRKVRFLDFNHSNIHTIAHPTLAYSLSPTPKPSFPRLIKPSISTPASSCVRATGVTFLSSSSTTRSNLTRAKCSSPTIWSSPTPLRPTRYLTSRRTASSRSFCGTTRVGWLWH